MLLAVAAEDVGQLVLAVGALLGALGAVVTIAVAWGRLTTRLEQLEKDAAAQKKHHDDDVEKMQDRIERTVTEIDDRVSALERFALKLRMVWNDRGSSRSSAPYEHDAVQSREIPELSTLHQKSDRRKQIFK